VKEILVQEELVGRYLATDLIDEKTGKCCSKPATNLPPMCWRNSRVAGVKELPVLGIDHVNVGPYIRNTMAADKNATREEALIDIYRVMRPGEPPTLESAEAHVPAACSLNSTATICRRLAASR
jgi:DNA-directed RNA polymerase subunit beta